MDQSEFYSMVERRDEWAFSHLTRAETKELTHSYHKYPAKFIPQLAKSLIMNFTDEKDFIWDPFCGSGTLNVEAFRTNRKSLGTDINPIAVLISRVKTTPLEPEALSSYREELLEDLRTHALQTEDFYLSKGVLNGNICVLRKWFPNESLVELGHILLHIRETEYEKKFRDFALCAFSSILKRSSYWLNSSIKSQIDPKKDPETPLFYFEREMRAMERANELFYRENGDNPTKVHIFKHNAKHCLPPKILKPDCVITSPPYLVSYDYSDIFRLSTYFLFYRQNYRQFRENFIGTPLCKNSLSLFELPAPCMQIINSVNDAKIKRTLIEYYKDMGLFFENARRNLKKKGQLIMVVGDTKLRGVKIPNAYLLAAVAKQNGWRVETVYDRMVPVKILPTLRDESSGRFTNRGNPNCSERYSKEYILMFRRKSK